MNMKWNSAALLLLLLLLLAGLLVAPRSLPAQQGMWDGQQVELSRAELERLLHEFEGLSESRAYSSVMRGQARREADLIRARLERGDFQIGDQIALTVEGEAGLTGGFVVQAGPRIVLPLLGPVSLAGVLRSELESHLEEEVGRYVRSPTVRARSSIRIMVTGAIGSPGYLVVPTDLVFTDVLMAAGGPGGNAELAKIRVERNSQPIWNGAALQQAIIEGRTLDQLSIQAGDHVIVPDRQESSRAVAILRTVGLVLTPLVVIERVLRIF
jgi:protein involved in polysaccharide export with SLBB domain